MRRARPSRPGPPPAACGSSAPRRPPRSPPRSRSSRPPTIAPDAAPHGSVRIIDEPADGRRPAPSPTPPTTELPHWTEPPTGQVPAVLARDDDGTSDGHPAAHLARGGRRLGGPRGGVRAVDVQRRARPRSARSTRPTATDEERRPWEFDLDSVRARASPARVRRRPTRSPSRSRWSACRRRADAPARSGRRTDSPDDETGEATVGRPRGRRRGRRAPPPVEPESTRSRRGRRRSLGRRRTPPAIGGRGGADADRPSGTPRVGRARRAGLLPGPTEGQATRRRCRAAGRAAGRRAAGGVGGRRARCRPPQGRPGRPGRRRPDRRARSRPPRRRAGVRRRRWPSDEPPVRGVAGARRRGRRPTGRPARVRNYAPEVTGGGPPSRSGADRATPTRRAGGSTGLRVGTGMAVAVVALSPSSSAPSPRWSCACWWSTFAAGEAFAVLRRAGWRPATLLGLVGTISLMVGAYTKGVAALPLVLVLITVFTLLWYLFGVERGSPVAGTGVHPAGRRLGGAPRLLRRAAAVARRLFPDRHGIAFLLGRHHRHRGQRRRRPGRRRMGRAATSWPRTSAPTRPGRAWSAGPWPRSWSRRWSSGPSTRGRRPTPPCSAWWWPWWPRSATCASPCSSGTSRLKDMGTLLPGHGGCSTGSTPSLRAARHLLPGPRAQHRVNFGQAGGMTPPTGGPADGRRPAAGRAGDGQRGRLDRIHRDPDPRRGRRGSRTASGWWPWAPSGRSICWWPRPVAFRPEVVAIGDAVAGRRAGRAGCPPAPRWWPAPTDWPPSPPWPTWWSTAWWASPGCRSPWPPSRPGAAWRWPTRSRSSPAPRWWPRVRRTPRAPRSSRSTPSTVPSTSACGPAGADDVARLLLTASGGPFRGRKADELAAVGVDEALAHPTWSMGPKITVDSSTLMNKGLEVIEAHELFGVPYDAIDVVVHPQSVVHSMVEFVDGAVVAQLSLPGHATAHRLRPGLPRPAAHPVRGHRLGRAARCSSSSRPTGRCSPASTWPTGPAGPATWPRRGSTPPTRWPWRRSWPGASAGRPSPRWWRRTLDRYDAPPVPAPDGAPVEDVLDADATARRLADGGRGRRGRRGMSTTRRSDRRRRPRPAGPARRAPGRSRRSRRPARPASWSVASPSSWPLAVVDRATSTCSSSSSPSS